MPVIFFSLKYNKLTNTLKVEHIKTLHLGATHSVKPKKTLLKYLVDRP